MQKNVFIYLIGFPGVGKLTIAREIQKLVPSILVDNHLINNTVFSLIDTDGVSPLPPRIWDYTLEVRAIVLRVIRELARPGRNFLFTNALVEGNATDLKVYEDIVSLARDRGARLLPVRILVTREELCRRVASPERKERLKAIDPDGARDTWERYQVLNPEGCFELEVSELSPGEAAAAIKVELERRVV